MSTFVCEKQFTLEVVGIRPPTNYWKLQSIVAGKTPASVGSIAFNVGVNFSTEAGGIIGPTCFKGENYAGQTNGLLSNSGDFNFGGMATGWTFRFWVKCDQPTILGEDITDFLPINPPTGQDWLVFPQVFPTWGAWFTESGTLNPVYAQDIYPIDSNWHRGVVIFDAVGKNVKWKMDNQATITTHDAAGFFFNPPPTKWSMTCAGNSVNRHIQISEIGLWQNILLTESELLLDWNNGNGLTFP